MADQQNFGNSSAPSGQTPVPPSGGQGGFSAGGEGFLHGSGTGYPPPGASGGNFSQGGFPLPSGGMPGGNFSPGGAGFSPGGAPGTGFPPIPPVQPEDTTPANFQLGTKLPKIIGIKVPAHSLQFDEQYFLHLLACSISLTKEEKIRIIESIPKLHQSQIDELIRIFEEERRKFAELPAKNVEQLKKLDVQHYSDWMDIELKQKQQGKKSEDEAKAEAIRKQLGLS